MIRQLLSFCRKGEQKREPVKIDELLEESSQLLRSSIPRNIKIRSNIADNIPPISGDATQIQQVILNLCTNAAHAMEKNGGTLTIELHEIPSLPTPDNHEQDGSVNDTESTQTFSALHSGSANKYVQLIIRDTGCGIEPAIKDKIFDPYFTTKDIDKGTGMGLSIVQGIVKSHDGHISVSSTQGRGTRFKILFPAVSDSRNQEIATPLRSLHGNEQILIVDDEPMLVEMFCEALEHFGYRVTSCTNPLRALSRFKESPWKFDLVMTDMSMPDISGDRLMEELLLIRPDIPIIVCSGFNAALEREELINKGAKEVLDKPFDIETLGLTIRQVLENNGSYLSEEKKCS
ncbi:putative Histidine kinase [Desulfamplus magnetovallimortis]|uniref:histidine kinase n=1 Tax=Desulfamplus magnetovallimortis TaxID=1246637 RepID=A0A1W1HKI2_9BACT|nr:ATP-binding protein [Desulfamplus magnetovallimortis]SLM32925.1 putative Histidine kinase [Desulfamplus magnetovallimortis]